MNARLGKAWLAGWALVLCTATAVAQDSVEAVQEEFKEARAARSLGVDKCLDWIERLYALADAAPASDEGFAALELVLDIAASRGSAEIREAAAGAPERIVARYADDVSKMGPFLMRGADEALVKQVLERTTNPAVKATCLYLEAASIVDLGHAGKIPDDLAAHALGLLETVRDEYGAALAHNGRPFREVVEGDLFQLENLRIGMIAPDIEGADLDGVPFKLSDYRGKVVVLDFWGNW